MDSIDFWSMPVHDLEQRITIGWEKPESCEKRFLGAGDRVDSIDFWSMRVRDLEQRITIARQAALDNPPTTSYFVFFSNQKDAAIAAQTNLHAEDGHSFKVGFAVCVR